MEYGTLPDWVGAISTFGALVAAVVAGVLAGCVYKIEYKRDKIAEDERRERAKEARQAQAVKVSAWWQRGTSFTLTSPRRISQAIIRNASELPIREVQINYSREIQPGVYQLAFEQWIDTVPPSNEPMDVPNPPFGSGPYEDFAVDIYFDDASGRRYHRDIAGRLTDLKFKDIQGRSPCEGGYRDGV